MMCCYIQQMRKGISKTLQGFVFPDKNASPGPNPRRVPEPQSLWFHSGLGIDRDGRLLSSMDYRHFPRRSLLNSVHKKIMTRLLSPQCYHCSGTGLHSLCFSVHRNPLKNFGQQLTYIQWIPEHFRSFAIEPRLAKLTVS